MIVHLLFGFPEDRPGGLSLTILYFVSAALLALGAGIGYAAICTALRRAGLVLQGATAVLRGIPLLMLVFMLAQLTSLSVSIVAVVALTAYSFTHVGETCRSFLSAYPDELRSQARVMGLTRPQELLQLRVPRTLAYALDALATHWVSLLKDTGALLVLSIGELTTVTKVMSENTSTSREWIGILALSGALYLGTTLLLVQALEVLRRHVARVEPRTVRA